MNEYRGIIRQANRYRPAVICEESISFCLQPASGTALSEASSQALDKFFATKRNPAVDPQYRHSCEGMLPPTRPAIEQGPGYCRALSSLDFVPPPSVELVKKKGFHELLEA
jgi:hypothetical protein